MSLLQPEDVLRVLHGFNPRGLRIGRESASRPSLSCYLLGERGTRPVVLEPQDHEREILGAGSFDCAYCI